jgi:uncharacterized membrane protein YqjE
MDESRPTLIELVGASRRAAQRTLDMGANRLELLIVELHEERDRLVLTIILALGAAALALLAGFAFTLGVMVLLWDKSPVIAMGILMTLYGAGAFFLYSRVVRLQRNCEMFTATLEQLRKDRECLAPNLR